MGKEIERKWILKEMPNDLHLVEQGIVEQIYLSVEPEIRLRSSTTSDIPYRITVKSNGTLSRDEFECPVTEEFFNGIREFVGKKPIKKHCHTFDYQGYELFVSIVDDGEFIYSEVEFPSEEEAMAFVFPTGDAVEVTENSDYKMKNYWKRTRLDQ